MRRFLERAAAFGLAICAHVYAVSALVGAEQQKMSASQSSFRSMSMASEAMQAAAESWTTAPSAIEMTAALGQPISSPLSEVATTSGSPPENIPTSPNAPTMRAPTAYALPQIDTKSDAQPESETAPQVVPSMRELSMPELPNIDTASDQPPHHSPKPPSPPELQRRPEIPEQVVETTIAVLPPTELSPSTAPAPRRRPQRVETIVSFPDAVPTQPELVFQPPVESAPQFFVQPRPRKQEIIIQTTPLEVMPTPITPVSPQPFAQVRQPLQRQPALAAQPPVRQSEILGPMATAMTHQSVGQSEARPAQPYSPTPASSSVFAMQPARPASSGQPSAVRQTSTRTPQHSHALAPRPASPMRQGTGASRAAYGAQLTALIEQRKEYPRRAKRRRQEGVVTVEFDLDRSGHVTGTRLVSPSGHSLLDKAAVDLIRRRIGQFPPPPPELATGALTFTVPISYVINR